jgi:hypothetical protein
MSKTPPFAVPMYYRIATFAEREAKRLEALKLKNPERFEKARRLAEVTVFSLDDWLADSDAELDRAIELFCAARHEDRDS